MMNRKAARRARRIRRTVLTVCLMALVAVLSIGGTIAWLMDDTDAIVNTFTVGNVDITLVETEGTLDETNKDREFKMVPGDTIDKNPKVTVVAGSEDCYLYVKVTESSNLDKFISYEMADGWVLVSGKTDVYKYTGTITQGTAISVLKDDQVTVNGLGVTKADMDALTEATYPNLTFKAYAIQKDNLTNAAGTAITTADAAWDLVEP